MAKKRTPPFAPYPVWTTAKFWSFLRSALRSKFTRWPPKYEVLKDARRKYVGRGKQQKWEFLCSICECYHPQKNVEVDHIIPCGSLTSFSDLPGFVERLFCGKEGLRVVCKPCHKAHTKASRSSVNEEH
jgi:hypothetical protein